MNFVKEHKNTIQNADYPSGYSTISKEEANNDSGNI